MEIFPASSQRQFDFIKRVIQRCDYYVIIIGGRYGTLADDEFSYTEREYDYAVSLNLPTLAFLHSNPEKIEVSKSETDKDNAERLVAFRRRLEGQSLVDYWENPDQLATKVVAALAQEISSNPGTGWVRGDTAASGEILAEINDLRKENQRLEAALAAAQPPIDVENLAGLADKFTIHYSYKPSYNTEKRKGSIELTWEEIFKIVGPAFRTISNTTGVSNSLKQYLREVLNREHYSTDISMTDKEQILTQFELMGLMQGKAYNLKNGGQGVFQVLTARGLAEALRLNAVTTTAS